MNFLTRHEVGILTLFHLKIWWIAVFAPNTHHDHISTPTGEKSKWVEFPEIKHVEGDLLTCRSPQTRNRGHLLARLRYQTLPDLVAQRAEASAIRNHGVEFASALPSSFLLPRSSSAPSFFGGFVLAPRGPNRD
jgi:hypothetical protein